MRYCLDTSAYSNFKRGQPEVVDLIDHPDWLVCRRSYWANWPWDSNRAPDDVQ